MANRVIISPAGMKISRPGVDVTTATLPNDFLFNSDYMVLNLLMAGTASVPNNAGGVTIYYPFTTSVIPFFSGVIYASEWEHIGRAEFNGSLAICRANVTRSYLNLSAPPSQPNGSVVRYSLWLT
jgi:hypothetical protein